MLWFFIQIGYDRVGYDYMDDDKALSQEFWSCWTLGSLMIRFNLNKETLQNLKSN
jgi:hypothetical protein